MGLHVKLVGCQKTIQGYLFASENLCWQSDRQPEIRAQPATNVDQNQPVIQGHRSS